jgi:hypothetical protein
MLCRPVPYVPDPEDLESRREALRNAIKRLQELKRLPIFPFEQRR